MATGALGMKDTGFDGKLYTPCCRIIIDGFAPDAHELRVDCPQCGEHWLFRKVVYKGIIDCIRVDEYGRRR